MHKLRGENYEYKDVLLNCVLCPIYSFLHESYCKRLDKKVFLHQNVFSLFNTSQQCFSEASTRRPADLLSSFSTIKTVMNNLYDGLSEVLLCLLKNAETRENVLEYLGEVINKNSSRAHMQVRVLVIALFKI